MDFKSGKQTCLREKENKHQGNEMARKKTDCKTFKNVMIIGIIRGKVNGIKANII